ncbi:MAG: N5-glutamine methyltransferase family protein, partial [Bdellovibrionales bacterium]
LLCEFQGARGIGTDLSHGALAIAAPNATALGVGDRARFTVSNWLDAIDGTFDLIISNPPYIESDVIPDLEKDVRDFDPILALDGGKNGLQAYQNIFSKLKSALKSGGVALLEIGFDQDQSVMRLSEKYGLRTGALHRDLAGNPRVVEIFL